jgi:hypothetical protein
MPARDTLTKTFAVVSGLIVSGDLPIPPASALQRAEYEKHDGRP